MINIYHISGGSDCLLDCEYCHDSDKKAGEKKEILKHLKLIKIEKNSEFSFVTGEPLKDIDFLIEVCDLILKKELTSKIRIHTSGLYISKKFSEYKKNKNIKIYLSADFQIDKFKKRKYKNGEFIFKDVLKNITENKNFFDSICITYNEKNIKHLDKCIYFYYKMGIKGIPIVASEDYKTFKKKQKNLFIINEFKSLTAIRSEYCKGLNHKKVYKIIDCNNYLNNINDFKKDINFNFYINNINVEHFEIRKILKEKKIKLICKKELEKLFLKNNKIEIVYKNRYLFKGNFKIKNKIFNKEEIILELEHNEKKL